MRISQAGFILALGLALAGCQRTAFERGPSRPVPQPSAPAPLTPAPVGGVEQSQLPAPGASNGPDAASGNQQYPTAPGGDASSAAPGQTADLGNANGPEIKREALIGRWTVTTSGASCDLFLSLTKWTGGYRAASRNCSGAPSNISAWDVQGNQVVLQDNVGTQIAALNQSGKESYKGSTATGQAIALSR